jgi:hypothetical protein
MLLMFYAGRALRRPWIESRRSGRWNVFVLGRWLKDAGAYYEHFYPERLYVRSKENLMSELHVMLHGVAIDQRRGRASDPGQAWTRAGANRSRGGPTRATSPWSPAGML